MFCSTIIPTIGRPTLARAVESVLAQNLPLSEFEVIVVNDSGVPMKEAGWQKSEQVHIINTNRRERSVARNTGASIAKGKYLHFLDDDDWVTPSAYRHFRKLSQGTSAKWLYGITQLVNRKNEPSIQLRHNLHGNCFVHAMSGEWIPLQASLIDRETFLRIGGFNPLLVGPEDIDLLRRILLEEEISETPHLVAQVIMGGEGSTTDYVQHPQASRWARESILDAPTAHRRIRSSAGTSFWKGRMARIYLTSAVWNLEGRRFFTVVSRLAFSLVAMLSAGTGLISRDFWHAVLRPYASVTFEQGILEAQKAQQFDL